MEELMSWFCVLFQRGRRQNRTGRISRKFARGGNRIGDAVETGRTAGARAAQCQPSPALGKHIREGIIRSLEGPFPSLFPLPSSLLPPFPSWRICRWVLLGISRLEASLLRLEADAWPSGRNPEESCQEWCSGVRRKRRRRRRRILGPFQKNIQTDQLMTSRQNWIKDLQWNPEPFNKESLGESWRDPRVGVGISKPFGESQAALPNDERIFCKKVAQWSHADNCTIIAKWWLNNYRESPRRILE